MLTTLNAPSLTSEPRAAWQRDGYLILRGFFDAAEMAELAAEADHLLDQHAGLVDKQNLRCRFQPHHATGECLFETFDPVIDLGTVCRRLALDGRLLATLADLYGERAHLFKDKLIFKPPGAKGYGLHQDYIAWPNFPRSFLTVLIPIDAADAANGCTEVFPGYHRNGLLTPEDGDYHELPASAVDPATAVKLELAPGDIAIFDGFTPHRSDPNRSDGWRRQLYLSYNAARDGGDRRDQHYQEFHEFLRTKYAQYNITDTYFR